jgi:hypothetical protein
MNAEEALKVSEENELGQLHKSNKIGPETFVFIRSWMQMILISRCSEILEEHLTGSVQIYNEI